MIYFFYGDPNKIFAKTNSVIESLLKKNSGSNLLKIDSDNFDGFNFDELVGGQSLFTLKQIIYLKRLFENKNISPFLFKKIGDIAESENIFLIAEEKLDKKTFSKIEKVAEKVQNFEFKKEIKREQFPFSLVEAIGKRDYKKAWFFYYEKLKESRPEEIHGAIWWQFKTMLSANKSADAKEAGLKPFVFSKAKANCKNYSEAELNKKADDLVSLLQESRRGGLELELAIEKFILNLSVQQDSAQVSNSLRS